MNDLTTIIIACGSPPHLFESINSVTPFCQEVVIIDIGLHEQIHAQILSLPQVRVVTELPVTYVELIREKSKNFAQTGHILFLDPDEIIPAPLAKVIAEQYASHSFLKIPRKNIIWGKWISHARWWPDYQIRVFEKNSVMWPTTIHHQPQTTGTGFHIEAQEDLAILHYNYDSIDEYLGKMIRYAKSEAQGKMINNQLYTLKDALSEGTREFISRFFADEGYKEGMHGFALSFLQMMYYPLVYFYLWEGKKYELVDEKDMVKTVDKFTANLSHESSHWLSEKRLIPRSRTIVSKIMRVVFKKSS